jgi:hypothetical protein
MFWSDYRERMNMVSIKNVWRHDWSLAFRKYIIKHYRSVENMIHCIENKIWNMFFWCWSIKRYTHQIFDLLWTIKMPIWRMMQFGFWKNRTTKDQRYKYSGHFLSEISWDWCVRNSILRICIQFVIISTITIEFFPFSGSKDHVQKIFGFWINSIENLY